MTTTEQVISLGTSHYHVRVSQWNGDSDCVAEVEVREAMKFDDGTIEYQDQSGVGQRWTPNAEDAEIYLSGSVKWDGCSDWSFYPADNCMIHLCGPEDADELAWLIKQCYQIVKDFMNFMEY